MVNKKISITDVARSSAELESTHMALLAPLASQSIFWRAHYLVASPTLEAIPLIFWLTETVKPRVSVTLGIVDPVPHFAHCQALEKLGLDSTCLGVALAEGESEDFSAARKYNETHYEDLSQILEGPFEKAAALLDEGAVDFLLINQPLTQTLADEIEHNWLSKLSERGVILFLRGGDALNGFIDQIGHGNSRFTLDVDKGVYLVLYGHQHSDRLKRLCQFSIGKPGYLNIRNIFVRVGELHSKAVLLETLAQEKKASVAELTQLTKKIEALNTELSESQKLAGQLRKQFEDKSSLLASAQVKAFDLEASLKESTAALSETKAALAALEDKAAQLRRDLDTQQSRAAQAEQTTTRLRAQVQAAHVELSERFIDIAVIGRAMEEQKAQAHQELTEEISKRDALLKKAQDKFAAQNADVDALRQHLTHLEAAVAEAQAQREEALTRVAGLEGSRSWRVTAPLRKASTLFQRK